MKLFLDAAVSKSAAEQLRAAGHDVVSVRDWPADPGDEEILAKAFNEQRIVITADKDFGELVFLQGKPHQGIIRLVEVPPGRQAAICLEVIERYGEDLLAGAIVTAQLGRLRIRRGKPK